MTRYPHLAPDREQIACPGDVRAARRVITAAIAVAAALGLAACQNELTPDGSPYTVTVSGAAFTVANTGASGVNEREALVPSGLPSETASTYSATWVSGPAGQDAQNGVIFRAVPDSSGSALEDGVVLERSFFENPDGFFIVVYFRDGSFTTGTPVVLPDDGTWPLHLAAAISAADVLTFSVNGGPATTIDLDASQVPASGQTGTYVAHIPSGSSLAVSGVSTDGSPAPSPLS